MSAVRVLGQLVETKHPSSAPHGSVELKRDLGRLATTLRPTALNAERTQPIATMQKATHAGDMPFHIQTGCRNTPIATRNRRGSPHDRCYDGRHLQPCNRPIHTLPLFVSVESYEGPSGPSHRMTSLQEADTTAQTDTRGMYAEQPGAPADGNAQSPGPGMPSVAPTCTVHVRYRGMAPKDFPWPTKPTLRLCWSSYDAQLNPITPPDHGHMEVRYRDASGNWALFPYAPEQAISVPSDGNVEVQVISKGGAPSDSGGAIPNLVFLPWAQSQGAYVGAPFVSSDGVGGIGSAFYAVVCCLPWHNDFADAFDEWLAKEMPQVAEVNDAVFKEVFENYLVAFPTIDFIANPHQFQEWRGRSLALTDPELFDQASYMSI